MKPGESEAEAFAKLNAEAHEKGAKVSDPTMIIYYDPKDAKELPKGGPCPHRPGGPRTEDQETP